MSDVLDLNALMPQPRRIKLGEVEIEIQPPKTQDILKLGTLGQKLQNLEDLTDEQVDELTQKLREAIDRVVPELQGHELNTAQLMALLNLIIEMAMPPEAEALAAKGITVDTPKKAL